MSEKPRMSAPLGIDLGAAADGLPDQYRHVAGSIRAFRDAHSAHTDISQALDMLQSVGPAQTDADGGNPWAQHAVPALIYSAIVLYVRATKSSSDHRATFNLASDLPDRLKVVHDRLCLLRDGAIAHYGPGRVGAGRAWHEERVIIPLDHPGGMQLVAASRRVAFPPGLVEDATSLCQRMLIVAQREVEKRERKLVDIFDRDGGDVELVRLVNQHRISLADVFPDSEGAAIFSPEQRHGIHGINWTSFNALRD